MPGITQLYHCLHHADQDRGSPVDVGGLVAKRACAGIDVKPYGRISTLGSPRLGGRTDTVLSVSQGA